MNKKPRVLADSWYADHLGDDAVSLDVEMKRRCPAWLRKLAGKSGTVRGLAFFWLGRSFDLLVTTYNARGVSELWFLEGVFGRGRKHLAILEIIRGKPVTWRRHIFPLWMALIERPCMRRALKAGQVLTAWEQGRYARMYRIPEERMHFVPWPMRMQGGDPPVRNDSDGEQMVLSSGRAACDWATLFRAANERDWPLTVVCGARDLPEVQRLNHRGRARVMCDIPVEEHQALVDSATVYVLCLREDQRSSGQIRLMNAISAGTPVVATDTKGLEGYALDGTTALLVQPGDHAGLRDAVEQLLCDPARRARIRQEAFTFAAERSMGDYLAHIRQFVRSALVPVEPVEAAPVESVGVGATLAEMKG